MRTPPFSPPIVGAPGLKSLTISVPKLASLRSDLLAGLNLTSLSFSTTGTSSTPPLREFPDFSHLTFLDTLDLSYTSILELQNNFSNLVNLQSLALRGCRLLTKLAPSLSNCVKLQYIGCDGCKLSQADSIPNLSSTRLNQLILSDNRISTIWPDGLCQLSTNPVGPGLTLDLSYNSISDPPACFANTVELYSITFKESALTSIPTSFGNMPRLSSLTIESNSHQMTGGIPDLTATSLSDLHIENSGLEGNFPNALPTTLSNLRLNGNRLTGTIPDNIFATLPSLILIDLSDNDLMGAFPSSIGMTGVYSLVASNNSFTSIPDSIGQLPLFRVDFHDNNLNSIPGDQVWEQCSDSLAYLYLYNNRYLNGPLPVFWSQPNSRAMGVDLSGCSFTGDVPPINAYSLMHVILSDNALDGIIQPSVYGYSVKTFKVDRNALTGSIPPSLGNQTTGFPYVDVFDVSFNRLTGPIPSSFKYIFDLGFISEFSFNNNGIDGPLPDLSHCIRLNIFRGDRTKVSLCENNPQPGPDVQCILNDVQLPGSCGCESWYTTCTTNTTCPNPDFVVPVDPPGIGAPTPVLPPGSKPLIPYSELPVGSSPANPSGAEVPVGSATTSALHLPLIIVAYIIAAIML